MSGHWQFWLLLIGFILTFGPMCVGSAEMGQTAGSRERQRSVRSPGAIGNG